jgi:hypothetical protein
VDSKNPLFFGKKRAQDLPMAEYEAGFCAFQAACMAISEKTGRFMSEKKR